MFALLPSFLFAASLFGAAAPADPPPMAKPAWLGQEPLIIIGNWDSMPIFRRRVGGNTIQQEEDYAREHSEEAVIKLKELGVTMAVIHFYKGFGLEAEREHMADARRLADLCKKHGLRVGVYLGSTIAYETFLREKPDITDWFVPPFLGHPVVYGDQTFRKRVYFMHNGYREYMKRVLRIAIEDFKVDLIHFDNTSMQAQPPIFFHPQAIADFREFLRAKYSPEMLTKRLGFADVTYVEPPPVERVGSAINDPLVQEWADFRCKQLADYYGEMERYIRGLNPQVAVENNPHSGISGRNTVWEQGVDYPRLLRHTDVVWTEEGNAAGVSADGVLVSKIRSFKMASKLNNSVFTYTGGAQGGVLQMGEAMAYNRQNLGMVGGALAGYETPAIQRRYIQFYRANFDKYRGVESRAEVAVLHSFATMAYNNDLPWQSSMLVEQALIQAKVPFDIVFDEDLKNLTRYKVLVLPDQDALSDEQAALIRAFVNRGGGLLATEQTSLYTEWRLRRRDLALKDLFHPTLPVRRQVGSGRVAYIASVDAVKPKPPATGMTSAYWVLPANWRHVVDSVRWAAGGTMPLEVRAPLTVTAELLGQPKRLLVHLLNFDYRRTPAVDSIGVSLRVPPGGAIEQVSWLSPDEPTAKTLPFTVAGGMAAITVPRLATYGMVVAQLR
ncbi:MAG: beta-galactosidase trimerization domain-containing protein [Bryobacterales bacterium]|nr:beta-galactosidase trimerization domain-containing protein [Bryobacterales bacterium]